MKPDLLEYGYEMMIYFKCNIFFNQVRKLEWIFLPTRIQALNTKEIEGVFIIKLKNLQIVPSMKLLGGVNSVSQSTRSAHR